ncbi:type II toxin-antitoxin system Phd/YefM family antitoxin [Desulfonatronum thioautotrophicum]|uniref:type II toxin-antitoxin system Phd/YefM family antitoxin n=1 Tax=Desulfonatronum thioautotrophicum TaxID=617001 RepID=UPI00069972C9|nr:type II toxin-antitoxin system prevent-host-death family antitoxin [Desulfonatronum thioautotrophicum]
MEERIKIISDREFRNEPGKVRKALTEQDVVITSRGRPYAVLLPVSESQGIEEVLLLASRIRAQMALSSVRAKSVQQGLDGRLTAAEINAEIQAVREQRRNVSTE